MANSANSSQSSADHVDPHDYYAQLGVPKNASEEDIQKAYRKSAMKYHPDRNQGDGAKAAEERFKNVKMAYEHLSDPQKRAHYDHFGAQGSNGHRGHAGHNGGFSFQNADDLADILGQFMRGMNGGQTRASSFEDLFRTNFGQQHRRSVPAGEDIVMGISITMAEAYQGKTIELAIDGEQECAACLGSGRKSKKKAKSDRKIAAKDACPVCHGTGKEPGANAIQLDIPAGIESGMQVRIVGRGEKSPHPQGTPGDLYVQIQVQEDERYARAGLDLHTTIPVPWSTAALGGDHTLTLPDNSEVQVTIPAGTQHGQILRARSKGMPNPHRPRDDAQRGHVLMHVQVEVPTKMTDEQKQLLKELNESFETTEAEHFPTRRSWLQRLKNWLVETV